jgi:hypothetical protein
VQKDCSDATDKDYVIEDIACLNKTVDLDTKLALLKNYELPDNVWLSNRDINYFLWIFKNQFPQFGGLCDPIASEIAKYSNNFNDYYFVFSNGVHWVCSLIITANGCYTTVSMIIKIRIYNSSS